MKKSLIAATVAIGLPAFAGTAMADDSTLFLGFAYTFGAGPGVTAKYLSTNDPDKIGLAAGATYNFNGGIGCDVGASAADNDLALTFSYDLCRTGLQISGGALTNPK